MYLPLPTLSLCKQIKIKFYKFTPALQYNNKKMPFENAFWSAMRQRFEISTSQISK